MKRKSAKPRQRHRATLGFLRLEPHAPELAGGAGGGWVVVYHEFCWKRRARLIAPAKSN
jgi:hypothetical protein